MPVVPTLVRLDRQGLKSAWDTGKILSLKSQGEGEMKTTTTKITEEKCFRAGW